jgi:sugar/nucleoside kinase (ribokinase family)
MSVVGLFVGLATLDVVHRVAAALGPNEKVTAMRQDVAAGGPAANAAVTFAALGGSASLLTAIGAHPIGRLIEHELSGCGVRVFDAAAGDAAEPPISSVRVVDTTGERSVSSVNGLLHDVAPPDPLGLPLDGVVLVDGHHPRLALATAVAARAAGVPVLLDGGSWKPVLTELLGYVDVAICSADFDPGRGPGRDSRGGSGDAEERLLAAGVRAVAITRGGGPISWATASARGEVAVAPVEVSDTLGAGDVFHGAAAYAVARRGLAATIDGWPDVLAAATAIAGVRLQHVGPRSWRADPRLARQRAEL